jgi:hypothetical protein
LQESNPQQQHLFFTLTLPRCKLECTLAQLEWTPHFIWMPYTLLKWTLLTLEIEVHSDHLEYSTLEIGLTTIDATLGVLHWSALSELEFTLGIERCTQKDSCTLGMRSTLEPTLKRTLTLGLHTLAHLGSTSHSKLKFTLKWMYTWRVL